MKYNAPKFNDTVYMFLDLPFVPVSWNACSPGWYKIPVVSGGKRLVYPHKLLSLIGVVTVLESSRTVFRFTNVPVNVGKRVSQQMMERIASNSIDKTGDTFDTIEFDNGRFAELGFSSIDEYYDYWDQFQPYIRAERKEYRDLFYLFRSLGPPLMPGQKVGKDTPQEFVKPCDSC